MKACHETDSCADDNFAKKKKTWGGHLHRQTSWKSCFHPAVCRVCPPSTTPLLKIHEWKAKIVESSNLMQCKLAKKWICSVVSHTFTQPLPPCSMAHDQNRLCVCNIGSFCIKVLTNFNELALHVWTISIERIDEDFKLHRCWEVAFCNRFASESSKSVASMMKNNNSRAQCK